MTSQTMTSQTMTWQTFNPSQALAMQQLCEAILPGTGAVGPACYIDAALVGSPGAGAVTAAAEEAARTLTSKGMPAVAQLPAFPMLRALAIEAYYSDFRQPGHQGPGGWQATGFDQAPMARRAQRDFSFLAGFDGLSEAAEEAQ